MPFGLDPFETILTYVVLVLVYVLPLAVVVWIVVTLKRLQRGQAELLLKLAAIERRLRALP